MATRNPMAEQLAIEVEIRAEKASAIRRVAAGLEYYLAEMQSLEAEARRVKGSELTRVQKRFDEIRELARRQLWYLIVQREAMGLYHHDDVYEIYKVPKTLTF